MSCSPPTHAALSLGADPECAPPSPKNKVANPRGVLGKYSRQVRSAHYGAVTSP